MTTQTRRALPRAGEGSNGRGSVLRRVALIAAGIAAVAALWFFQPLTARAGGTVTNCADDGSAGSLRTVIVGGGSVTFQPGLDCPSSGPITLTPANGPLVIDASTTTIDATGHTIVVDGGCTFSSGQCQASTGVTVFHVNSGVTASLTKLTIQHGSGTTCFLIICGGGIFNDGGTLTLTNSTISDNSAGNGGGVYNQLGSVTVTNSTISDNYADIGGGIYNSGSPTAGFLTVTDSAITGNTAAAHPVPNGGGGGINTNGGTLTVTTSAISNNTSADFGGGISGFGSGTVTGSTFDHNTAFDGGGIYHGGSVLLTVTGSTFTNNTSHNNGGGFSSEGGIVAIANCTFAGNSATDDGGGMYYLGIEMPVPTVTNSTFTGNSAAFGGGIVLSGAFLNLTNTIVANSTSGGDLQQLIVTNGFSGTNNLIDDASSAGGFTDNDANHNIVGHPALLGSSNFTGQTEIFPLLPGSPALDAGDDTTCQNAVVNNADQRGITRPQGPHCDIGAFEARFTLTVSGGGTQSTIITQPFTNPLAVTFGGADAPATLSGVTVSFTAPLSGASVTLTGNPATTNASGQASVTTTANSTAGSYSVTAAMPGATSVTFNLTNLLAQPVVNSLAADGAANIANCGTGNVGACRLRDAVAAMNGGVTSGTTITFDTTIFPAATPKTITLDQMAGTLTLTASMTIDGTGHKVVVDGGCATDTNSNCTSGGVTVFTVNSGVTASLTGLTIQHGSAGLSSGGGIQNNGTLTLTTVIIQRNVASFGGGIQNNGPLHANEITLSGNTSTSAGGGLSAASAATTTLTNSTVSGNTSTTTGGGLYNQDSILALSNVTISGNTTRFADGGGGIRNETAASSATATLTNVTVSGNSAPASPGTGGGISVVSGAVLNATNTIVAGNINGDLSGTVSSGSNNLIGGTPLLASLGTYGGNTQTLPPLPGSPAIDAGSNAGATGLTTDQRGAGFPRFIGTIVDIGAFESGGFTLTKQHDGQSTSITTAFASPLAVTVAPTNAGEPVNGGQVTFTIVPGTGGASANFSTLAGCTVSGGNLIAVCTIGGGSATTPTLTANGTPGGLTVTAAARGAATQTFTLTSQAVACVATSTQDPTESGKLTLRDAVTIANAGGCTGNAITFDATAFPANSARTITLSAAAGTLAVSHDMTIDGSGHRVTISGGNAIGLFSVSGGSLTLNVLTLANGNAGGGQGGAVVVNSGALVVTNSTLTGNAASQGGAIYLFGGAVTVTNSTLSGNTAASGGGAIMGSNSSGTLAMTNSTVVGNSSGGGGQVRQTGALTATLTNTLVANAANGSDLQGTFSGNNNLIDDASVSSLTGTGNVNKAALVGTLGDYGGATQTIPLLPGSPAIDAGANGGNVPGTDQRGKNRVGAPDIGAFESQGFTLGKQSGDGQSAVATQPFAQPLVVAIAPKNPGEPVAGGVVTFAITAGTSGAAATFATATGCTVTNGAAVCTIGGTTAATPTLTANAKAGGFTVAASTAGAGSVAFSLTNTAPTVTLSPATLPNATRGVAYPDTTLTASGGVGPDTFAVTTGALPTGLTLNATTGVLSGTPTATGTFSFTVTATDAHGFTGAQPYTVTISAAPLVSIAVTPANGSLKVGTVQQYTATGTFADNTTADLTSQVAWSSSNDAVVHLSTAGTPPHPTNAGTATGPGTATVSATLNGVTGATTITVQEGTAVGVAPAPAPANRPAGAAGGPGATPAPSSTGRGGTTGGSSPAPVPTGR